MRILIVTPLTPPDVGGPSYYAGGLRDALTRAGHAVSLVSFKEVRHMKSGVRHLCFLYRVLLASLRVDALIILDTVSVALPAVIAGWVLGKRMVLRTGGDFLWETYVERTGEKILLSEFYTAPRAYTRKERAILFLQKHVVFRLAHRVVFSTKWQRALWQEPYGIPEARTAVVENAHVPAHPMKELYRGKKERVFLCVGRERVLKNIETLKEAFTDVHGAHPDARLDIRTDISQEELFRALSRAYVLVVPSLSEVSPNIVFEAIAVGTPVVCTADTGIRDLALPGVVFVDTGQVGALRDALATMLDTATYSGYCDALAHYTPSRTYDDVARDILKVLKK